MEKRILWTLLLANSIVLALYSPVMSQDQRPWTAFKQPRSRPQPPQASPEKWVLNPIDAFVLAALNRSEIHPAPSTDRKGWIRRVTYDLTGLPPTPEDVVAFTEDVLPDEVAYQTVVDRLLSSPRYGERWARHWLDVARYADTDGFAIDRERATLWRYRDYVIRALNADRPFDDFVREQLAGDELLGTPEAIVATSFYRLGPWEQDNMVPENRNQDFLNEITSAVGSVFLGITVGCARCHDHKYDPILHTDFYQLQAFFTPLKRADIAASFGSNELTEGMRLQQKQANQEHQQRVNALQNFRDTLKQQLADSRKLPKEQISDQILDKALKEPETDPISQKDLAKHALLQRELDNYKGHQRFTPVAVTIANPDNDDNIPATFLLQNGDVFNPGQKVYPDILSSVRNQTDSLIDHPEQLANQVSGRRSLLAEWIASPNNPFTARVIVNRLWQHHLGQGIVRTSNDFGKAGSGPSHPALLDYLADWLIRNHWSLKKLHRLIVLSNTYRLSNLHPQDERYRQIDPDNRLLWKSNPRRLEAETIRDAMISVSGKLHLKMGGPGFFERLPDEMETKTSFFSWITSIDSEQHRRSVYMFQRRNLLHPLMEAFDAAEMNVSCEMRQSSITTPQVFTLMNSSFSHEASQALAQRIHEETGSSVSRQAIRLFWLGLSRAPVQEELSQCVDFVTNQIRFHTQSIDDHSEQAPEITALKDLCHIILNCNEFIYLD